MIKDKIRKVVIIGAGGVGFWTTVALMREMPWGIPVEVWDDDDLMEGNGYLRLPVASKSMHKVQLLHNFIVHSMGDRSIRPIPQKLDCKQLRGNDERGTLFADCTDMPTDARRDLAEVIRHTGGEYLRVSYDGLGVVTVSPGVPFDAPGAKGGYEMTPDLDISFIAGGVGARAIRKALEEGIIIEEQWNFPALQRGNKEDVQDVNSVDVSGSEGL
jgi:hypothetical protein